MLLSFIQSAAAVDLSVNGAEGVNNLNIGISAGDESTNADKNDKLNTFNDEDQFIKVTTGGEK